MNRATNWQLLKITGNISGHQKKKLFISLRIAIGNLPTAQLYNLNDDVGEKNNLALKYPEKLKELEAILSTENAETNKTNCLDFLASPIYEYQFKDVKPIFIFAVLYK